MKNKDKKATKPVKRNVKFKMFSDVLLEADSGLVVYRLPESMSPKETEWTDEEKAVDSYKGVVKIVGFDDSLECKPILESTDFFCALKSPFGINHVYRYCPESQSVSVGNYSTGEGLEHVILDDKGNILYNGVTNRQRERRTFMFDGVYQKSKERACEIIMEQVAKYGPEERDISLFHTGSEWYNKLCKSHTAVYEIHNFGKYQVVKLFSLGEKCAVVVFNRENRACIWKERHCDIKKYNVKKETAYYVIRAEQKCMILTEDEHEVIKSRKVKFEPTHARQRLEYKSDTMNEHWYNHQYEGVLVDGKIILSAQTMLINDNLSDMLVFIRVVKEPADSDKDFRIEVSKCRLDKKGKVTYESLAQISFGYAFLRKTVPNNTSFKSKVCYIVDIIDTLTGKTVSKDMFIGKSTYIFCERDNWMVNDITENMELFIEDAKSLEKDNIEPVRIIVDKENDRLKLIKTTGDKRTTIISH